MFKLIKFNTSAVTDNYGTIYASNTLGTIYAILITQSVYTNSSDYVLTLENITSSQIVIRLRKVNDGSIPPSGTKIPSLIFAIVGT